MRVNTHVSMHIRHCCVTLSLWRHMQQLEMDLEKQSHYTEACVYDLLFSNLVSLNCGCKKCPKAVFIFSKKKRKIKILDKRKQL